MLNNLQKYLMISVLLFTSLFTTATPSYAQATATTTSITLLQLGEVDTYIMQGPFDEDNIVFGLPSDWQLVEGGSLKLFLGVSFNTNNAAGGAVEPLSQSIQNGGTLSVVFNNVIVGIIQLDKVGEQVVDVEIPLDALRSRRIDKLMSLQLILDGRDNCDLDQNIMIIVRGSSSITLSHNPIPPDVSLVNFPYTLFHDSFIPDSAIIVVPDNPTAAELQSAFSVIAGLGNLTSVKFAMSMTTVSLLTTEHLSSNHIILIGKAGSLPILSRLKPSVTVVDGQFKFSGSDFDDGIIQMLNSPWSSAHAVLIVSGNSDVGIVKAAQALSTGVIRPSYGPNISVVKKVNEVPVPTSIPVDTTLADLGYENASLQSSGTDTFSYTFYIPPGKTVTSEAFFELAYGHSSLLNYGRTGIVVRLNGSPIGSIRMSDETAVNPINLNKISLPSALINSGINRLDLRINLEPKDICASFDLRGEWITIWPQSRLHLPLSDTQAAITSEAAFSLSDYPAPFINDPTMGRTAFVLEKDDLTTWQSALGVARFLGANTRGVMTTLKVFFADDSTPEELANYNLILVGYPDRMKILKDINQFLPAPFEVGNIATEKNVQVDFRIPADSPIGYIEILPSPWNADNIILAVLGNTQQGVIWATAPLGDSPLRSRLAGNFASINDQQIITADTRLITTESANSAPNFVKPVSPEISPVNSWIPLILSISVGLLFITVLGVLYFGWLRNRARTKVKNTAVGSQHTEPKSHQTSEK